MTALGGNKLLMRVKRDKWKKTIEITFFWNLEDYPNLNLKQVNALQDAAEERIYEQRKEGNTSGELHYEDDEISVWGGWSFSYY